MNNLRNIFSRNLATARKMALRPLIAGLAVMAFGSLPSAAADKPELTVYTYDAFAADWGPAPAITKAFEAECECTLKFVGLDSSVGILSRLKLEGASTEADVVLGLDTNLMETAKESGLLVPHGADTSALKLPIDWSNDTFMPFDFGYFSFVYNKETIANPPKSFDELAAREDLSIVIQDPRSSTPGLGLLLWIKSQYGDQADAMWKKLEPRIVTVTKGWSDAYGLFLEGEADMVLSYTTSPAYHVIAEEDQRFAAAAFDEGHYMQVEVAAAVKGSDEEALAKQFIAFITTDGFQDTIPTGNWMYPVTETAKGLPEGFGDLVVPAKSVLLDASEVEANRRAWVDEWLAATGK